MQPSSPAGQLRVVHPLVKTGASTAADDSADAALVREARQGDTQAEDALYRRHARPIIGLVARLLGDGNEVDDVVQDTFLSAFSQLARLREPAAFPGWLRRIAVDRVRRLIRRRRLQRVLGLGPERSERTPRTKPKTTTQDRRPRRDQDRQPRAKAASEQAASPPPVARWRRLAEAGRYSAAFRELGKTGLARRAQGSESPSELRLLVRIALRSDHPRAAVAPLDALSRHENDSQLAASAAFRSGRVHMDRLDAPAEASARFERALSLGLPAGLEEEALLRLAQARRRKGDTAAARQTAREYLKRFEDGYYVEEMTSWLPDGGTASPLH